MVCAVKAVVVVQHGSMLDQVTAAAMSQQSESIVAHLPWQAYHPFSTFSRYPFIMKPNVFECLHEQGKLLDFIYKICVR